MKRRFKNWLTPSEDAQAPLGMDLAIVLKVGLLAGICLSIFAFLSAVILQAPNVQRLGRDALLVLSISLLFLYFLRRGWVRAVTIGLVLGFGGLATWSAFTGIGVRGTSYGLFILVIILSALFIHRRAAYVVALLAAVIGLGLLWASHAGYLPNINKPLTESSAWMIQTIYFFMTALILDLVLRQIDQAFHLARHELAERVRAEEEVRRLNSELEQRIAERTHQLAVNEERYRRITEVSSDYVFSSDVDIHGKVSHTWVAGAFASIMECSFEEYIARGGWVSFLHPDDLAQDMRDMEILFTNQPVLTEVRIITALQNIRWVSISANPVWSEEENRLVGIYGAVQDITSRKQAEQALREAEVRYRTLVERTSVVIYRDSPDLDAATLYISPQIENLLGYPAEAWMNRALQWQKLVHPDDLPRVMVSLETNLITGGIFLDEYRLRSRDGWWVWVRDEAALIKDADGTPLFIQGVLIDITDQKMAEARERLSAQWLRAVVEITDELILIPDLDTFYRRAVELAREKLALERCSLFLFDPSLTYQLGTYGTTDQGLTSDERFLKMELKGQVAEGLLDGERSVLIVDANHVAWDDLDKSRVIGKGWIATSLIKSSTRPLGVFSNDAAISGHPVNQTQQEILLLYCSLLGNIIERKWAEEALREAELRYRTLVEQTSVVIYRDAPDIEGTAQYISPRIETLLGYTAEEWLGDLSFWQNVIHPDDRARAEAAVKKYITDLSPYTDEYRLRARNGNWVWVRDEAVVVKDEEGKPRYVQGVLIDVTEQKHAEAREQFITQGLRAVLEITDELILIPDLDTFYRRAVELAREKLHIERCGLYLFDPDLEHQIGTYGTDEYGQTTDERYVKMEMGKSTVERLLFSENKRFWSKTESEIVYWNEAQQQKVLGHGWVASTILWSVNRPIGVLYNDAGISHSPVNEAQQELLVIYCSLLGNIIERKRAEEALGKSEKRFRALVEHLPAITYSDDIHHLGQTIYISPQLKTILGYSPEEWLEGGLDFWLTHMHPQDREHALAEFEACFQQGDIVNSEYRMFTQQGDIVWMQDHAVRLEDENGQPTLIQGVMVDITERKLAEESVKQISEGLRAVLEAADELILATDLDTIYRRAVELARQKLGLERCALFLFDSSLTQQIATFGTDAQGKTTDERGIVREISSWALEALTKKGERSWVRVDSLHSYWDNDKQLSVIGRGWIASTIIRSTTQPIGVFYNDTAMSKTPINETQQEILTVYCSLLGNIIERKQFEQHLQEQATRLLTLYELSREIVSSLDFDQVCVAAHRAVENLMPTDAFFISLVDQAQNTMEFVYLYDNGKRWPNESSPLKKPGLTTHVYQKGETLWIHDDADGTSQAMGRELFGTQEDTRSVLISPLKLGGNVIGLISAQHYQPHQYTSAHVQILETLANQIAIAIEHARLVQSLRLQAAALDAAANAIVITDQAGQIQWVNPAFTQLTGYTLEEILYENPHVLKSGVQDENFYRQLWETIQAGQVWQGEIVNRHKDGHHYVEEMIITPVRDEQGQIFRFIAIKQDITARKKTETLENRRRLLLEKVIELGKAVTKETDLSTCLYQIHQSIHIGFGFDRVGIFLYEATTDLLRGVFGTSRTGEIEDTRTYTQVASTSKAWLDALSQPTGMNFIQDYEAATGIHANHEMAGVREHVSLVAWAGSQPVALIAADNLITQRPISPEELEALQLFAGYAGLAIENARWNAELEARVAERTNELQAANQELQSFTYTIAHDLRAPARAMIGFSGLLEEHLTGLVQMDPVGQNYLTRVHHGAQRMGQMIDELLEYTRLGRTPLRKQPVNMNTLVDQALKKFQTQINQRNIELVLSELPASQGDPKWLEFVWEQLISNAIKFTRPQETPLIEIGSGIQDQVVFYFIRDNGIGFDMRYAHKLFGVFQRLQIEDEYEGTGMGLALSERIIEKHGGRIWVEAQLGKGALFRFTLGE